MPDGVFQVVHGDKEAVDLCCPFRHRRGQLGGSTPSRKYIYQTSPRYANRSSAGAGQEPHGRLPDAVLDRRSTS